MNNFTETHPHPIKKQKFTNREEQIAKLANLK